MAESDYTPVISSLQLPGSAGKYYLKDAYAREVIETLSSYSKFLGVTTTELTDGDTTNPITIGGETVTATAGCIAIYDSKEFIFDGTEWQEFGDLSAITDQLGSLAYKNSASTTYTPSGSVSGTFVGSEASISATGTTTGSVTVSITTSNDGNYTPAGTITAPSISLSASTTTINEITGSGSLPTLSGGLLSVSMGTGNDSETLIFTMPSVSSVFDPGSLPTYSEKTILDSYTADYVSSFTFSGTKVLIDPSFSGSTITVSGSYTPEGSLSGLAFTGSSSTITVE